MKQLITIIAFFSFIDVSFALNERKELQLRDGSTQIRVLYGEENLFFVDTYVINRDGWQDRIAQKVFDTSEKAKKFFHSNTRHYKQPSPLLSSRRLRTDVKVPIWEVTNQWSAEWESKYSTWVQENLDEHFFVKYQIPTDCADVAFAIRWIFARINGLPAAATLAGSLTLFTQSDGRASWETIPTAELWYEDSRFRKALQYVLTNTYTHSLLGDSYPVEINPFGVVPGTFHLTIRTESGHTRMIYSTNPNGTALHVIRFVASDVPAQVRELNEEPFSLKKYLPRTNGGFMRFRWPRLGSDGVYELTPETDMPNFAMDQYGVDFEKSYYNTVLKHMGITNKAHEFIHLRLELAWQKLNSRVALVEKGYAICQAEDCAPGSINYENWGTPSRDGQVFDLISELLQTFWENTDDRKVITEYNKWKDLTLKIGGDTGLEVRYEDLLQVWYNQTYTSDPRDSVLKRWGFEAVP